MEPRPTEDERRLLARRIFAALCEQYPDRYIAIIEQPKLATGKPKRRTGTAKAAPASKQ